MTPPMRNSWPLPEMPDEADYEDRLAAMNAAQRAYEARRRAHAEAIGRPIPDERHAVWPR